MLSNLYQTRSLLIPTLWFSVFETNIRVLGGLLSGHVLANYVQENFKPILSWYKGELLALAKDIGYRLLPAFNTSTGIPHPRVSLYKPLDTSLTESPNLPLIPESLIPESSLPESFFNPRIFCRAGESEVWNEFSQDPIRS